VRGVERAKMAEKSVRKTIPGDEEEQSSSLQDSLKQRTTVTAIGKVRKLDFWKVHGQICIQLFCFGNFTFELNYFTLY